MEIRRRGGSLSRLVVVVAVLLAAAGAAQAQTPDEGARELGRSYTRAFYDRRFDELWSKFSPEMRGVFGEEKARLEAFRKRVGEELGDEVEVVGEDVRETRGYRVYLRTARFSRFAAPVVVQWAMAGDGTIAGFFIRPKE